MADKDSTPLWRQEPTLLRADQLIHAFITFRNPPYHIPVTDAMVLAGYYAVTAPMTTINSAFAPFFLVSDFANRPEVKSKEYLESKDVENWQSLFIRHLHLYPAKLRPVGLRRNWLTTDLVGMASELIEEQRFDGLPILADLLEELGCTWEPILNHCRQDWDKHLPHSTTCAMAELIIASHRCYELQKALTEERDRVVQTGGQR